MLKRTCRLRDFLESRGHGYLFTSQGPLESMCEAEFTGSSDSGFPNDFRWETFVNHFDCDISPDEVILNGFLGQDALDFVRGSIRNREDRHPLPNANREKIRVLWLSPTLFISSLAFLVGSTYLDDFCIIFSTGGPTGYCTIRAYSLQSFQETNPDEPSPLSLEFLCHLAALLPVQYFQYIWLRSYNPRRFSSAFFDPILSIIPRDAAVSETKEECRPTLSLSGTLDKQDLQAIFSHHFHPGVHLDFVCEPFDESVSLRVFSNFLKHSRYLRSLRIPVELVKTENCEVGRLIDIVLKSKDKSIWYGGRPSRQLYAIAKDHHITELTICAYDYWKWFGKAELSLVPYILPFLTESSCLERLRLRFDCYCMGEVEDAFTQVRTWEVSTWRGLCFFNISASVSCAGKESKVHTLSRVRRWDQVLFPWVVLKNFRQLAPGPLRGAVVAAAVKATNEGIVYRKATHHVPYDRSIANAAVIFRIFKKAGLRERARGLW
jgi:hypothetical protein